MINQWKNSRCALCAQDIKVVGALTETHLIPNALGGRLKPHLLCEPCNSELNNKHDSQLIKSLSIFASLLDVGRHRNKNQPIKALGPDGQTYLLTPGSLAPNLQRSHTAEYKQDNGLSRLEIRAPNRILALNELKRLSRHYKLELSPERYLENTDLSSDRMPYSKVSFELPLPIIFSASFIYLWLFSVMTTGAQPSSTESFKSRLESITHDPELWYCKNEPWLCGQQLPCFRHRIILKNHKASQKLIGYIDYFGAFSIGMVICNNYKQKTEAIYAYDLTKKTEISNHIIIDDLIFEAEAYDSSIRLSPYSEPDSFISYLSECLSSFLIHHTQRNQVSL